LREYAGPGHWNDPDMLEVGNGMTVNEDRAHFSMWCMLAAPLISGNDLRNMSEATLEILANKEVIAVDQDKLGVEGFVYSKKTRWALKHLFVRDETALKGGVEIWFKPLSGGSWAMCVLNRNKEAEKISFNWKNEKVADSLSKREAHFGTITYSLRDLWSKQDGGDTSRILNAEVPAHGVLMLRLDKI
jgi:alpha-galactosidase